jgi:hypothetical protein
VSSNALVEGDLVQTNERIIRPYGDEVNGASIVCCRLFRSSLALSVLLIVLACLTFACSGREGRAQKLYEKARTHIEQTEFDEAVRLYQEILDKYPGTEASKRAREEIVLYRGLSTAVDSYPVRRVRDQIVLTARAIYRYEDRRRKWPRSLGQLTPDYLSEPPIDPWGRELIYFVKPRGRGYLLGCYGSDGRLGGDGDARDWYIEDGRFVKKPSVELP